MTEQELTPVVKPNIFLFNKESISRSMRGVNKIIRRYKKEVRQSVDQKFIASKQEKVRKLTIISAELKQLCELL